MSDIREIIKTSLHNSGGCITLRESASFNWLADPARVVFSLTRYKFVSRMLDGFERVLEVGCADGFGSTIVSKTVRELTCVDIDEELINSAISSVGNYSPNIIFNHGDIMSTNFLKGDLFDAIYLLDVLEHIPKEDEDSFIAALTNRLSVNGTMIIGMPSLESQAYASEISKMGHINCKTAQELRLLCNKHFLCTYMFGANDEMVNTGYPALQHYRLALCNSPRKLNS